MQYRAKPQTSLSASSSESAVTQERGLGIRSFAVHSILPVISWLTCLCGPLTLPLLITPPAVQAQAEATVQDWSYNPALGRLDVTISGSSRPVLFTLDNPSRIVLDFPSIVWGRPELTERYEGRVQTLRISQFSPEVTRIVLDVDPAQPITNNQLQLLTASPNRWAVQLLTPPEFGLSQTPVTPTPIPTPPPVAPSPTPIPRFTPLLPPSASTNPPVAPSPTPIPRFTPLLPPGTSTTPNPEPSYPPGVVRTHIRRIRPTSTGFFVRTDGPVRIATRRIFNPDRVAIDFIDTDISQLAGERERSINRFGVRNLRVGQFQPTVARIVLDVSRNSGSWQGRYDAAQGGVLLYPEGSAPDENNTTSSEPSDYDGPLATLQSVQLIGNQLVITADGFLFYDSDWDPSSRTYSISVNPARLPSSLPDPGLGSNSPVERIRFSQQTDTTVRILIEAAQNFEVYEPSPGQGSRRITLQFLGAGQRPGAPPVLAPTSPPSILELLPPLQRPDSPAGPSRPTNPNGIIVALDAGHGGRDPGAIGVNGLQEKEVNFDITRRVQQLLIQRGFNVVMTRSDDREILLQPRINTAITGNADIFVSIHTNAFTRSNINGIETYYSRQDSLRLAQVVHNALLGASGAANRGVRRARFYVVRETPTTMPSVLLELGFLTNPAEAGRLATSEYRQRLAQAIANGIATYYGR